MKILLVQTLRLGDVLMMAPVIAGIRRRHPEAEIHMVINSSSKGVVSLLDGIDRFHLLERDQLQGLLVDAEAPILAAFDRLNHFIKELRQENFDLVINLTQNRLSGYLTYLVEGQNTLGLKLDAAGRVDFGSPWFRYLNHQTPGFMDFHFSDIFALGSGLNSSWAPFSLPETEQGLRDSEKILNGISDFGLIQISTSDVKKNWGESSWIEFLNKVQDFGSRERVYVLGSPGEKASLERFQEKARVQGVRLELAICDLETAYCLLKRARWLVTLDTSIKHLAISSGTKIIELCLGGSDLFRTGILTPGSLMIKPNTGCHPCRHSQSCYRDRHYCASDLNPEAVAIIHRAYLSDDAMALSRVVGELNEEVSVFRSEVTEDGLWIPFCLSAEFDESFLKDWVRLSAARFTLQGRHLEPVGEYGSEGHRIARSLRQLFPNLPSERLERVLEQGLDELETRGESLEQVLNGFKVSLRGSSQIKDLRSLLYRLEDLFEDESGSHRERELIHGLLDNVESPVRDHFLEIRQLQCGILERHQVNKVQQKIMQSMETQMVE